MNINLSICIPTYNFGRYIGETLAGIVSQIRNRHDVEIVVVDGGSTDDTFSTVSSFQRQCPLITYYRLPQKGGIDNDLALSVELAQGEYCWLLSSDDVPIPGAVDRLLNEIGSGNDIYLFNRIDCDSTLAPLRAKSWLAPEINDCTFTFSAARDYTDYFDQSRSLGALFSYISSIIVRRVAWRDAPGISSFIGSNYAHVGRLFAILQRSGILRYIREPLVLCRGYNDSFLQDGVVRRFLIDIDGYLLLASSLFDDARIKRSFLSVMRRQHKWYVYVEMKSFVPDKERWHGIAQKLSQFGYPRGDLILIDILGSFPPAIRFARAVIMAYRKIQFLLARVRKSVGHRSP